jgi:hypothetical protein
MLAGVAEGMADHAAKITASSLMAMLTDARDGSPEAPTTPSYADLRRLSINLCQDESRHQLQARLADDLMLLCATHDITTADPLTASMLRTANGLMNQLRLLATIRAAQHDNASPHCQAPQSCHVVGVPFNPARAADNDNVSEAAQHAAAQLACQQLIKVVELAASRAAVEPKACVQRPSFQAR